MDPSTPAPSNLPPAGQVSRRRLVKGTAWAVPVIMATASAPAIAASRPCSYKTATWNTKTSNTSTSGSFMTATAAPNGTTRIRPANLDLLTASNGGDYSGQKWVSVEQAGNNSSGQTISVQFTKPVYCVSFYVTDIDTQFASASNKYRDQVTVPNFTATTVDASRPYVTASGGQAKATNTADSSDRDTWEWNSATSQNGLVKFTDTSGSPVSSFTLTFNNISPGTGTGVNDNVQQIYISPLQYSDVPCACN